MKETGTKDVLASTSFVRVDTVEMHYRHHNLELPRVLVDLLSDHKVPITEKPITKDYLDSLVLAYDTNAYGLFTHLTLHNNSRNLMDVATRYRNEKRTWKSLTSVDVTALERNVEMARHQFLESGVDVHDVPNILISALPSIYIPKGRLEIVYGVDVAIAAAMHYQDTNVLPAQNVFVVGLRKG